MGFGNDANTYSLLHFDGTNGSTTFPDTNIGASAKTWTANGAAALTTSFKEFGSASLSLNGSSWIDTPANADFGALGNEFTFECWFLVQGGDGTQRFLFSTCDSIGSLTTRSVELFLDTSNRINFAVCAGTNYSFFASTSTFPTAGAQWNHVAIVRTGNTNIIFINGVPENSSPVSGSLNATVNKTAIGRLGEFNGNYFIGCIDEFRYTFGGARYTTNFSVPTMPFGSAGISASLSGSGGLVCGYTNKTVIYPFPLTGAGSLRAAPVLRMTLIPAAPYAAAGRLAADSFTRPLKAGALFAGVANLSIVKDVAQLPFAYPAAPAASSRGDQDRHIRRSGDDYAQAFAALLPPGLAWPRALETVLMTALRGLAQIFGFFDSRAADLLERESDPRQTIELLPDWERNWGLPDACFPEATTICERQNMLVLKMTMLGGQSRAFFIALADFAGHSITDITEFSPFMCGISRAGDTRDANGNYRWQIGPPEMRFYWTARAGHPSLTWFRAGSGQAGVDHHLNIGIPADMECLLRRWKPGHTELVYDFSALASGGPMQGTP